MMKEWAAARSRVQDMKNTDNKAAEKLNKEITIVSSTARITQLDRLVSHTQTCLFCVCVKSSKDLCTLNSLFKIFFFSFFFFF